ncbi:hypothetical protein ACU4GG_42740 [Streptomyces nojiriensis]
MIRTQTAVPVSPAAVPAAGYRRVAATGVSTAFGTFGELLQGCCRRRTATSW